MKITKIKARTFAPGVYANHAKPSSQEDKDTLIYLDPAFSAIFSTNYLNLSLDEIMEAQAANDKNQAKYQTAYSKSTERFDRLAAIGVDVRWSAAGYIEVACKLCGKFYLPTQGQITTKLMAGEGKTHGEANLYCSDACKEACPLYKFNPGKMVDPRSEVYIPKSSAQAARDCQTDDLKKLQCDDVGYNFCESCGDIIDVELHHTQLVSENGMNAVSSAGHMLLCPGCHSKLHAECAG